MLDLVPRRSTLYTVVLSESRTGTLCRVLLLAVIGGEIVPISRGAAEALGLELQHGAILIRHSRGDAGSAIVEQLGSKLHADARAFRHMPLA